MCRGSKKCKCKIKYGRCCGGGNGWGRNPCCCPERLFISNNCGYGFGGCGPAVGGFGYGYPGYGYGYRGWY